MKTLLALAFVSTLASADPRIDNMVRNCESAMAQGVCRVVLDKKDYPNEYVLFATLGRVRTDAYLWIKGAGETKNPDGSYVMCSRIKEACSASWDGSDDRCKAARFNWRQK
jgi:hypothetical protein